MALGTFSPTGRLGDRGLRAGRSAMRSIACWLIQTHKHTADILGRTAVVVR